MTESLKQSSDAEAADDPTCLEGEMIPEIIDLTAAQQPFPESSVSANWNSSPFSNQSPIFSQGETKSRGRGRGRSPKMEDKTPCCRYRSCGSVFPSKEEVKLHVAQHHASTTKESVCADCGQAFASTHGLNYHMSTHTGNVNFPDTYIYPYILSLREGNVSSLSVHGEFYMICHMEPLSIPYYMNTWEPPQLLHHYLLPPPNLFKLVTLALDFPTDLLAGE